MLYYAHDILTIDIDQKSILWDSIYGNDIDEYS